MLETIIEYDRQLFLLLNGMGMAQWDAFWLFLSNKWGAIPLYLLLLILCLRYLGLKKTFLLLVLTALLITLSDQLANLFKYGFKRLRPCYDQDIFGLMRLVKENCGGRYSFFSAHASNSMAVATLFSLALVKYVKPMVFVLLFWSLAVAYSRIYLGVHFPIDIVVGISLGMTWAYLIYLLYQFLVKRIFKSD